VVAPRIEPGTSGNVARNSDDCSYDPPNSTIYANSKVIEVYAVRYYVSHPYRTTDKIIVSYSTTSLTVHRCSQMCEHAACCHGKWITVLHYFFVFSFIKASILRHCATNQEAHPVAIGPGVYSASNRNEYQRQRNNISGV
jgi:hypothetical protein